MKTFVIGDLHNYVQWVEPFLKANEHDRVIFLGDYFDDFGDTTQIAERTAQWLASSVQMPNRIHIMGNHDMPYRFPWNSYFDCPGWTPAKQKAISNIMTRELWDNIKMAHFDHDIKFIYSHAGLTSKLFKVCPINGCNLNNFETQISEALTDCNNKGNKRIPIFQQNPDYTYDGITWIRFPHVILLPEVTQIIGHTPTSSLLNIPYKDSIPVFRQVNNGVLWDIDCAINWVGVVEDGEFYCINRHDPSVKFTMMDNIN
jgi:hypothetical protein